MQRDCVFSTSFKRRSRQTSVTTFPTSLQMLTFSSKLELQRELDNLRAQYESPTTSNSPATTTRQANQTNPLLNDKSRNPRFEPSSTNVLSTSISYPEGISSQVDQSLPDISNSRIPAQTSPTDWTSPQIHSESGSNPSFIPSVDMISTQPTFVESYPSQTTSRRLGDVELSARKIDGCFNMFVFLIITKTILVDENKVSRTLCFGSSGNYRSR
jgi:hypothetical protein